MHASCQYFNFPFYSTVVNVRVVFLVIMNAMRMNCEELEHVYLQYILRTFLRENHAMIRQLNDDESLCIPESTRRSFLTTNCQYMFVLLTCKGELRWKNFLIA